MLLYWKLLPKRKTMGRKYKHRVYPRSIRLIKTLEVVDIKSIGQRVAVSDTSVGSSVSLNWVSSRQNQKTEWEYDTYIKPQEMKFFKELLEEDFSESERNDSTATFYKLVRHYKEAVQSWIINIYNLRNGDEELLIQLFRLLRCFPYEFLAPASLCLAELAVHHQSDFVKSEALSLMDHWGNKEVLRMMKTHEPPLTPWLKMKYYAIIDSLERYVALQENR